MTSEAAGDTRPAANAALPEFGAAEGANMAGSILAAAIAAAPTGVVISDPSREDCPIVFLNPAFTRITGYAPEEVLGRNCRFLQGRETDPRAVAKVRRAIAAARPVTVEMVNYRRDGSRFWNELRIAPVFGEGGRLAYFIGIQHDVTLRRRAEERAARARRAAERASRTKSDFLATMSHEIRTPMNGMLGTLALLGDTELTEEQRSYVETARRCGQDLLAIINDILDISRIEAGMLRLDDSPFALADTIRAVLDLAAPVAAAKGITLGARLDPALPPVLRGDAQRLRQVLRNLVDNAVKFTAVGGVTVTAERLGAEGKDRVLVRLAVADTGIGIPPEVQAKLFRHWTQADASIGARFGGSGLGLTICRRLVTLMGGTITLTSAPGRGSTFTVTLPLAVAAEGAAVPTPAAAPLVPRPLEPTPRPGALGRILLAEDSRANQIVAATVLRRAGYAVEIVEDGEAAVARAASGGFDLVLMDVQMPKRTGLEATAAIRSLGGEAGRVPIVAMTAAARPEDREACLAAGMDGYVAKPVDPKTLLEAVARALAGRATAPRPPSGPRPAVDPSVLAEMAEAVGPGRMAHLLSVFSEETEARLAQLERAVADGDLSAVAHLAHGLRSAAGTFGATALAEAARALEQACGDGAEAARRAFLAVPPLAAASLEALRAHAPVR
ncbi:response regulator [Elioraea tepida]|uniref:Sensory/regulatory protein RpfC n=1 Tax=Elioraea tepida TaxID=2843330 RepID=A0A975TZZ3_9PROT|nr:ATP-binding protein [Elioraea tepida]QXM23791.1 response regulator [Elioraea tepida]